MTILLTLIGLVLLLAGGEIVVRAAVRLATRLGISPLVIGITIVGIGTALPEMVVCVDAAISGSPGLSLGNVIGSNIANAMLVLGVAAVICPVAVGVQAIRRDSVVLVAATVAFSGIGFAAGRIDVVHGALMIVGLSCYLVWVVRHGLRLPDGGNIQAIETQPQARSPTLPIISLRLAGGLVAVLVGAECLVAGAVDLAVRLGVSDEVIGLTLIAIGTSLPEIATSLAAAWRGRTELCLGNVIGSNIFNILGIAGVTSLFAPLPFAARIVGFDLWVLLGTTAVLLAFMILGRRINRSGGILLASIYVLYMAAQFLNVGA